MYGLREEYKNSADELVNIVLENGEDIKMLDIFIFPILFSYRHSIEISLKHIYRRARGKMLEVGHNLLTLWDKVKNDVIDEIICSEEFISLLKHIGKM